MGAAMAPERGHDDEEEGEDSGSEEEAQTVFDVYEMGQQLGAGNFGEVRLAWRRDEGPTKAQYAVKIVDQQSDSVKAAEAFIAAREEAHILEGLQHPNIVEMVEMFEDDRFLYVVMDLIPGGELFKALMSPGLVVLEQDVTRVGRQILEALNYLHQIGIVHRDIKAQNILLAEPPVLPGRALEHATIKIVDFGLACKLQQDCVGINERQLDLVCGTPAMCAPEIWASQDSAPAMWKKWWGTAYGPKVDVWATGVVLYLMLLGQLPFDERHPSRLASKVCDPKLLPTFQPASKTHQVSPAAVKCLASLLEKAQADRPTAAKALRDPWLAKGSKTRGMVLTPIPDEVRIRAALEAKAALEVAFEEVPRASPQEHAERAAAFEAARAAARVSEVRRRRHLHLPSARALWAKADGSDNEEERRGCRC